MLPKKNSQTSANIDIQCNECSYIFIKGRRQGLKCAREIYSFNSALPYNEQRCYIHDKRPEIFNQYIREQEEQMEEEQS
jgi:hypothetical protein